MTLTDLKPGQRAEITGIDTSDDAIPRLMVLGLVEGSIVQQARAALGGDPLQLHVFGSTLSIRRAQASAFTVEPLS